MVVVYSHYFLGPDVVVLGFHSQSPGTLVAAWTVLLEWAVVITVVAAVISVCFTQKSYLWLPTLQCSIMGATVGLLMAAWVSGSPATKGRGVACGLSSASRQTGLDYLLLVHNFTKIEYFTFMCFESEMWNM